MREVNKKDSKKEQENVEIFSQKRKAMSMLGFLISIVLLTIAIFLSMKQEKADRLARIENSETNITKIASSDISKNINEVKEKKNANKTDDAKENNTSSNLEKNSNKTTQNSNKNSTNLSENSEKTNIEKTSAENSKENNNQDENELSNIELEDDDIENANANINVNADAKVSTEADANTAKDEGSPTDDSFIKPCDGEIIRPYSMDSLVYSDTLQEWITHRGIDIKGEMYQEVRAAQSGTIKSIKNDPRYGTSIIIEHKNGFKTVYSCLLGTRDGLEENQEVKQGDVIGKIGNSGVFETADGAHLHFEMLKDDGYVNPNIYIK